MKRTRIGLRGDKPVTQGYTFKFQLEQGLNDTTGAQAEAYADHFIKVHLAEVAGGKTYSQVSTEAMKNPTDQKLQQQVQTLFRGETLRGLLLTSYAFDTLGDKAQQVAIACYIGAAVSLVLALLGFWHYRRTPAAAEI